MQTTQAYKLKQEQQVFDALCGAEFLKIMNKENMSYAEYKNITLALGALGFSEMCEEHIANMTQSMQTERDSHVNGLIDVQGITNLCSVFLSGIRSGTLRELFESYSAYSIFKYKELNEAKLNFTKTLQ